MKKTSLAFYIAGLMLCFVGCSHEELYDYLMASPFFDISCHSSVITFDKEYLYYEGEPLYKYTVGHKLSRQLVDCYQLKGQSISTSEKVDALVSMDGSVIIYNLSGVKKYVRVGSVAAEGQGLSLADLGKYQHNMNRGVDPPTVSTNNPEYSDGNGQGRAGIVISDLVTSIGDHEFSGNKSLTSIVIPNRINSIGEYAFSRCESLTSIEIPNSVTSIGKNAFSDCTSLESVLLTNGITSIESETFMGCESLTSIIIPEGVTSIGDYAFSRCESLTSIEIPNSVTSIGKQAFSGCESLTSIIIPESVTSIGEGAFSGCPSIFTFKVDANNPEYSDGNGNCLINRKDNQLILGSMRSVIPKGVTSIGDHAFSGCKSLTSIIIPEGVTSIGDFAFSGCKSLTSIKIPNSVVSIGGGAFRECKSLEAIVIPDSVTSIGSLLLFQGCESLVSIKMPDRFKAYEEIALRDAETLRRVRSTSNSSATTSEPYSWIKGKWYVELPNVTTAIMFNGNGQRGTCVELQDATNPHSMKKGNYYVKDEKIHYTLEGESVETTIEIQNGNKLYAGGGFYFKKIQE